MKKMFAVLSGAAAFAILFSCSPAKRTTTFKTIDLDTVTVTASASSAVYRASVKKENDLIHTKLELNFNWEKQQLEGKETITLHPHFYSTDSLVLDAKGMLIHQVKLKPANASMLPLNFTYDSLKLIVHLDKMYSMKDTFAVYIEYTARPTELHFLKGKAMDEARGLYFINPDGKEKNKPRQVWSQGETESASCWFPTIDSPNQKMTQEICLTVDTDFISLSNGSLEFSFINPDGTRTDCWKQSLPASPYLSMIAAGEFAEVKDKWRNLEVNYYVEKKYAPYAKQIFGNTPEMIEFFSKKLGVDYPWEKFSQVAVRDFVSGAMENTTVVVHGEDIQLTPRQMIDNNREVYISHELFHQWFGDLVTCESWSNLPLNESFADYGEYLWSEYKYGRDEADIIIQTNLNSYLRRANKKDACLIRYYYDDKEEMFDVVSYQKGGRVLHMLRTVVGDEAFFASLKLYLETNKFSNAEVHDLRLAFEKITGEDLNWFFNEWFLKNGNPELTINYQYNDSLRKENVRIDQIQDYSVFPVFKMPLYVDLYFANGKTDRKKILLSKISEEFSFPCESKPLLVNFDAEKTLVCSKKDNHSIEEWIYQYHHAPLYADRYEALIHAGREAEKDSSYASLVVDALDDKNWHLREIAVAAIEKKLSQKPGIKEKLIRISMEDPKSVVRAAAIKKFGHYFPDKENLNVFSKAAKDNSYSVTNNALEILKKINIDSAFVCAQELKTDDSGELDDILSELFSQTGSDPENDFFVQAMNRSDDEGTAKLLEHYGRFLLRCNPETLNSGIQFLENTIRKEDADVILKSCKKACFEIQQGLNEKEKNLNTKISSLSSGDSSKSALERDLGQVSQQKIKINSLLEELKKEGK